MAINPFTIRDLQLPAPVKTQAIDFSPLQSLGAGIGAYRRQQDIGSILAGATDAQGNLDPMRAASELGKRGYVKEAEDFIQNAIRQQSLKQSAQQHGETQRIAREGLDLRRAEEERQRVQGEARTKLGQEELDFRKRAHEEGRAVDWTQEHPLGLGPARRFRTTPDGKTIELQPPTAPAAPAVTPGPRSEVPELAPGPVAGATDPAADPTQRRMQVAALGGVPTPDMPPATPPATRTAQVAPGQGTSEPAAALEQVARQYGPQAAQRLREIISYQRPLPKDKTEAWRDLARQVDPGFDELLWERREKEAKQEPRKFTYENIGKMTEEGGLHQKITDFNKTFKEDYAKPTLIPGIGSAAMLYGRKAPDIIANKGLQEASNWWQGYDSFKNTVRHGEFGATLTKNEQEAFDKANVDPSMNAKLITKNLARQQSIIRDALTRRAKGLIAGGFDSATIAETYGLDLKKDLGIEPPSRGGGQAAPAKVDGQDIANRRIEQGNAAIARERKRPGGDVKAVEEEVLKMWRDMGVPNPERHLRRQ